MKMRKFGQDGVGCIKYYTLGLFSILIPSLSIAAPFGLWINANSTNSYSDASKWIAIDGSLPPDGIPGPGNDAYIFDGTLQVGAGGNFNPQQLIMGWENWHVGEFLQTGGTVRTEYWTKVGNAGNQVFNQTGGTFSAADLAVGWVNPAVAGTPVGVGVMNLSGGTFDSRGATFIGLEGATGTIDVSGGTFNASGNSWGSFRIADYGVGTGSLNLSGTGVVNASQYTAVGGNGNGTLNISGGIWNQLAGGIVVGDAADLNWTGRGDVNQSGGTVNADYILLQKGTYNLDGGNLSAFGVADTKAETTGVFNFNGGMLWAAAANTNFLQADTVEIKAGGALIHTREHEIWIQQPMTGAGGLVKGGTGILKLTATNNYGGETRVVDGTLVISGSVVATNAPTFIVNGGGVTNSSLQITDNATFKTAELNLGYEGSDNGSFEQADGTTRVEAWTRVGWAGNMVFNQSGGTFSTADLAIGWKNPGGSGAPTGTGTVNLSGGTFTSRLGSFIGLEGGAGTLNITGGTYNATGNEWGSFRIANFGEGTGTVNLSGTGVVNASQYSEVGGEGNGVLNISGGTWNQASGGIVVGDHANPSWMGRGDVNQNGGTVNADWVLLQQGTYNLNGGDLFVDGVGDTATNATGVFNFNGGRLVARVDNPDFVQADNAEILAGGAIIDTQTHNVAITQGLSGGGGLTKQGAGILTLSGPNTYTGSTKVDAGSLVVSNSVFTATILSGSASLNFVSSPGVGTNNVLPGALNAASLASSSVTGLGANFSGRLTNAPNLQVIVTSNAPAGPTFASTYPSGSENSVGSNGLQNLMSYALGGTGSSSSPALPVLTSYANGLTLTANIRNSGQGVTVVGQVAESLNGPWTDVPLAATGANSTVANTTVQAFSITVETNKPRKFLRFKATK